MSRMSESKRNIYNLEEMILKKYESVFILDIRKVDDEGEALAKEFDTFIAENGDTFEYEALSKRIVG